MRKYHSIHYKGEKIKEKGILHSLNNDEDVLNS